MKGLFKMILMPVFAKFYTYIGHDVGRVLHNQVKLFGPVVVAFSTSYSQLEILPSSALKSHNELYHSNLFFSAFSTSRDLIPSVIFCMMCARRYSLESSFF